MTVKYIILAIGVLSLSFAALFIRLADAPPLVIAAYRLCLASLVLIPFSGRYIKKELPRLSRKDLSFMVLAGLLLAIHFGLWINSLRYTSVVTSVVLVTTSPIFLAIASRLVFKQRLSSFVILGIIISITGTILISYGNWQLGEYPFIGAILALGGAVAISGYLLIGQRLRSRIGIFSFISVIYCSAAVFLLASVIISGYSLTGYSTRTYTMMILLAVIPQLIGHSSVNWSLRFIPATLIAIAVLGESVGAAIWAFLFLGETITFLELAGSVLLLTGIYFALKYGKQTIVNR